MNGRREPHTHSTEDGWLAAVATGLSGHEKGTSSAQKSFSSDCWGRAGLGGVPGGGGEGAGYPLLGKGTAGG